MTDEELISYRDDVREFMIAENEADTRIFQDVSKELISRLARGRKAIEFAEALIKHRDNGVDLEADGRIYNLIDEYQQSCKEAADEQCDRQS